MSVLELFKNPLDVFKSKNTDKATFMYNVLGVENETPIIPAHCQRQLCWTDEQYRSFIHHSLETRDAGSFILYHVQKSTYIVDGQHRKEAWRKFIAGELDVKVEGHTVSYADFTVEEKRKIKLSLKCVITMIGVENYCEKEVEEIYNRFNFTGVRHE